MILGPVIACLGWAIFCHVGYCFSGFWKIPVLTCGQRLGLAFL